MGRTKERTTGIFVGVLFLAWVGQTTFLIWQGNWGWRDLLRFWQQPLAWRSARFYRGPAFAERIAVLRAAVPPDALLVLPSDEMAPLGKGVRERELEWFLFPRRLTNCLDMTCMRQWLAQGQAFVLWSPGAFELSGISRERLHPLSEDLIVVAPTGDLARYWFPEMPIPVARWLVELGAELLLLGLMTWGGWGVLAWGKLKSEEVSLGPMAWAVGSGGFTLGVYGLLLVGLSLQMAAIVMGVIMVALGGVGTWKAFQKSEKRCWEIDWPAWGVFALLGGWTLLLAFLAVGKGYHATDALVIWGIKGYGIAHWGLRQGTYLGLVRDYPLHVPLLIALPKALWGDLTGMSKVVFPSFLLGILALLYWESYRRTRRLSLAFVVAGMWATAPLVVRHAEIAYANLPMAFYLLCGVWAWHVLRRPWLAGVLLAWSAWTRPEGWLVVGAVIFAGVIFTHSRRTMGSVLLFPGGMTILWLLTRRMAYTYRYAPGVLETFLPGVQALLRGQVLFPALVAVLSAWERFLWPRLWGVVGWVVLAGLLYMVVRVRSKATSAALVHSVWLLCGSGLSAAMAVTLIYYFAAYLPNHDIDWWIRTGFDRMTLPALAVLWSAVLWILSAGVQQQRVTKEV